MLSISRLDHKQDEEVRKSFYTLSVTKWLDKTQVLNSAFEWIWVADVLAILGTGVKTA